MPLGGWKGQLCGERGREGLRLGAEGRAEGQGQRLRTPPPPATSTGGLANRGASATPPRNGPCSRDLPPLTQQSK